MYRSTEVEHSIILPIRYLSTHFINSVSTRSDERRNMMSAALCPLNSTSETPPLKYSRDLFCFSFLSLVLLYYNPYLYNVNSFFVIFLNFVLIFWIITLIAFIIGQYILEMSFPSENLYAKKPHKAPNTI